ncbi:uncharacterized protein LOC132302685 [Cornus florida]|uniref:uncharacterized protein LOC132302685 n=1 Tax=Cornus florida TaxID=4283 RepID=UPI002897EF39|nr:uncharacterized protein LOC132302685 [Cornus florida]
MEDWNTLPADCIVISCCCECLILQLLVFVLLKIPYKLVRKTKKYAKKKLMHRKRDEKIIQRGSHQWEDEFIGVRGGFGGIQVESFVMSEFHGYGCCMEEVEKVLEDLSQKGVFAFGSFWGRDNSESYSTCLEKHEFDFNGAQYQFIEMVGTF